ncbi:MAG TPA: homogentisate 1,2-dioxygenase [Polyangiaceae bacterium]|jgi:homogentisate 1,2-dioxygenase|nr:homogentisate 1,2-dioxygenase [Polyangiaceae bacterium]
MLERRVVGSVPEKPHLQAQAPSGQPLYEECLTRAGFDGPFSILYRLHRPHEAEPAVLSGRFSAPEVTRERPLLRRHYRCLAAPNGGTPAEARTALLVNRDVTLGFARPSMADATYFTNADGDELFFVLEGSGTLRSAFGDLAYGAGDYVMVPKGVSHRFLPAAGERQSWLWLEFAGALALPARYRNAVGQLRMDAPYTHRDFRSPSEVTPLDEGLRELVVKRHGAWHAFRLGQSPLDVVAWDGAVYPFVFPILAFSPRVGQVHLPPPVHATFEAPGVLVCSFVPRPLDFHPRANPVPYPHSSVDVDEVLFYANDAFTSRRGIAAGSLSHHPAGIAHGPHPGAYEHRPAERSTTELAVMLDCALPLDATRAALGIEDAGYHASFRA